MRLLLFCVFKNLWISERPQQPTAPHPTAAAISAAAANGSAANASGRERVPSGMSAAGGAASPSMAWDASKLARTSSQLMKFILSWPKNRPQLLLDEK